MYRKSETAALQRDVEGTEIPGGDKVVLSKGSPVTVIQSLGGSYTVLTEQGFMVRVDGKDSDALGEKYVKAQAEPKPQPPEGPFEESQVWDQLRTVYDPEIPVNIVDLGLVYKCESKPLPDGGYRVDVQMTMTAPGCGMGGVLKEDIRHKVLGLSGVKEADVEVVWEPPWDPSRMSEAARLQLGWM
ncbi:MAG TPA: putative Fe-S cluster assembly protein SufT [Myxococcaceae bacterium]|nr:putative Fe-S cluster assembly protein SufT [Myxococcaceae bacterium]